MEKIIDMITGSAFYMSQLVAGKLPMQMYDDLVKNKIKIFPKSSHDLSTDCSCPDWAETCKHIAAVIYIIANEIDRDPFLVFKLHNFDIMKRLKTL